MSRTPYFYLEKYNSDKDVWEVYSPYEFDERRNEFTRIDFWPWNGTHEVFDALTDGWGCYNDKMPGVHKGLPKNVSDEVKKVCNDCGEYAKPYWISYADIYIDALENPEVEDYDEEAEYDEESGEDKIITKKKMKPSPAAQLRDRVKQFINILDWWDDDCKIDYRLVYWIC